MNYFSLLGVVTGFSRTRYCNGCLGGFLVLLFCIPNADAETTWRVPEDAATIQAAITAAVNGDVVLLTEPLYTGDGNRDINFLGKAVTVRSESDDPDLCVINCQGTPSDHHRGFVMISGEDSGSRLVGVTITGGFAPVAQDQKGGAIYLENASPEITNCRFLVNFALSSGGAIFGADSSPVITNCIFDSNSSDGGGGMTCTNYEGHSAPVLTYCLFRNNVADFGGGFELRSNSTPTLEYCTFTGNMGNGGGGGIGCDNGMLTARFCTFTGNSAGAFGGAGIVGNFKAGTTVENTIISHSLNGTAVGYWDSPLITFTCCNIYGNAGGDWVGFIADQYPGSGNLTEDPQFCAEDPDSEGYWELQSDSPCAEAGSSCGVIGSWGVGCSTVQSEMLEWGGVKALFQ